MADEPVVIVDTDREPRLRAIGRVLAALIVGRAAIAVVVTLLQWETRPQTDDATVRSNFVGIAPQVNGHIVELLVRDNQQVNEGDLLFQIDPRPYQIALERARATLALTRNEVSGLKNGAATAVAGVAKADEQLNASAAEGVRLETPYQHADDHLKRLPPPPPHHVVPVAPPGRAPPHP